MTRNQLIRSGRKQKKRLCRVPLLEKCPQKLGVCKRVYTTSPKKPHSGVRKVAKVTIRSTAKEAIVAIPGQGHSLQKFSKFLIRGGRVRDIPGVHYKAVRGSYDFVMPENFVRMQGRSLYGLKTKGIREEKAKEKLKKSKL